jgi:hypothetical protein
MYVDGWGSMMEACLIASRPAAIVNNLFVCRFVAGFTVGAVNSARAGTRATRRG